MNNDGIEQRPAKTFNWYPPLGCAAILLIVVLLGLYPVVSVGPHAHAMAEARAAVASLSAALKQYDLE
ncbi:MAG: hypothetical protein P4L99_03950 [Chthoniobacter sp.]|nr:hypothetical protein [Chthoniobacter sp.]